MSTKTIRHVNPIDFQWETTDPFQIWLNLPSSHKMVDLHFSMFWARDIPEIEHKDDSGAVTKIDVIAGYLNGAMQKVNLFSESDVELVYGAADSRLLLIQGKPIGEPVEQYGPFVMNSVDEIRQTMIEYNETGFGGWDWDRRDPVHFGKPCFAPHADGIEEYMG